MLTEESLKILNFRDGQIRRSSIVHNGGWYNSLGYKIGWGDLACRDFRGIQAKLQPDEQFIVLGEHDSFWNFVTEVGIIGRMATVKPEEQHPGIAYLAEKARWVITKDTIYRVDAYHKDGEEDGIAYKHLPRKKLAVLLANGK